MGHHLEFVKERVEPATLVAFLEDFLRGVRSDEAFEVTIGDLSCAFPADVLARSALDLEYQHDPHKTELEITVEWRHDPPHT